MPISPACMPAAGGQCWRSSCPPLPDWGGPAHPLQLIPCCMVQAWTQHCSSCPQAGSYCPVCAFSTTSVLASSGVSDEVCGLQLISFGSLCCLYPNFGLPGAQILPAQLDIKFPENSKGRQTHQSCFFSHALRKTRSLSWKSRRVLRLMHGVLVTQGCDKQSMDGERGE